MKKRQPHIVSTVIAVTLLVTGMAACKHSVTPAQLSQTASAQTPQTTVVQEPSVPAQAAAQNPPPPVIKPTGCYNSAIGKLSDAGGDHKTSETRQEFALQLSRQFNDVSTDIYASAVGKDSEYLLFVAPPENESTLVQLASESQNDKSSLTNFCMQQFAEVQYLIRDANMHQTLVLKIKTDPVSALRYIMQRGSATPVQ